MLWKYNIVITKILLKINGVEKRMRNVTKNRNTEYASDFFTGKPGNKSQVDECTVRRRVDRCNRRVRTTSAAAASVLAAFAQVCHNQ